MFSNSFVYLHKLRRNLRLRLPDLQETQWKMLKTVIKHAFENVSFYHRKFDEVGIKPDDIRSFADLSRVPFTTKSEIQASSLVDVVARSFDISRCAKRTTSGSTGRPLTVIVNKAAKVFWSALWLRAYFENGLRFRDKIAVISESPRIQQRRNLGQLLGVMRKEYVSNFDDANKQLALLEEYAPDVIKGYPSSLTILADACHHNQKNVKPRLIFTLGELLDLESRRMIGSAFESDVLDNYACAESGLLAWECRKHMGYHVNVDSIGIEYINDGEPVSSGESGEIVISSLVNYAMPLIRYQLGDVGVPVEDRCSCGVVLPLMEVLEGRRNDFLTTLDGRRISPTVFFPYPFEDYKGIKQFRIIQERRNNLVIQLVARKDLANSEALRKAEKEIEKLFGEGMQCEFQFVDRIDMNSAGKFRKIISRLPPNL